MWFWLANNSFKPASLKYISKVVHPKYLRGFYKYLLCLKKELRTVISTLYFTPTAFLFYMDATASRICSCPDGELVQMHTRQGDTHLWAQGGVLGTKRLRDSWCQEAEGEESLSQHELLSLNSWQVTRHFFKGKFIKPWTGEAGKGGGSDQRAGDHAMCHLRCSLVFSKILCYYSGLYVCYNIPNMKFTIFTILSIDPSGIKYIHIVVQPSPPSISVTLSSPQHWAHFKFRQVPPMTDDPCLVDVES